MIRALRLQPHFWLLPPMLASLPHATHLPLWLSLACAALWLWRLALALLHRPLPHKWVHIGLALAAVAAVISQFGLFLGRNAGVPLLILLLFAKLLETQDERNKRVAMLLTYFAALSVFLFDQSLTMTLYLLVVAWLTTATLAHLQPLSPASLWPSLLTAGRLMAAGLPLALALFLFFPRLDTPLWMLPSNEETGRSGLSDTMQPGDFGRLILSGEVAFRAVFTGPVPDPRKLYWRGLVLTRFDGRVWRTLPSASDHQAAAQGLDAPLRYTLTLEPHERNWLFTLGLPAALPPETRLLTGMQLVTLKPVNQRQRFELVSYPRYRLDASREERESALLLPAGFNPRARELAQSWRAQHTRPRQLMEQALAHFRGDFTYTLTPPPLSLHSVDEFLFTTRRGFCEHYASSFVFLMRAAGIPARVVTGYQGGEVNPVDGYLVVHQSDAHAWAEVWLPGEGWVQVDPTASVSPARVERGLAAALPAVDLPPALANLQRPWLRGLRHAWEAMNNGWNQWVLGYDLDRQMRLLSRISPALADRAWQLSVAILLAGLAIMAGLAWRGMRRTDRDDAARLYAGFTARLGLQPALNEGAGDFARRASQAFPALASDIRAISALYLRARYAMDPRALSELADSVKRFRPNRTRRC